MTHPLPAQMHVHTHTFTSVAALVFALGLSLRAVLGAAVVPTAPEARSLPAVAAALDGPGAAGQEVLAAASFVDMEKGKKGGDKDKGHREWENGELPPVRDTVGWVDPRLNGGRLIDVSSMLELLYVHRLIQSVAVRHEEARRATEHHYLLPVRPVHLD